MKCLWGRNQFKLGAFGATKCFCFEWWRESNLLKEFLLIHQKLDFSSSVEPSINPKWQAPPSHELKLNVDVAFALEGRNSVGVGAVVRDHLGHVRAAFPLPRTGAFKPDVGELFAAREALLCASWLQIKWLESDSR
ncbi:hypothetical protein ACOSQ2_009303 [Xanthoceras sorbifolium]